MKRKLLIIFTMGFMALSTYGQTWRSSLYPSNWTPSGNFYTDKIIQDFSYAGYHRNEKSIPDISNNIKDVTQAPYYADKTGASDATAKIQKAINDAAAAGGGVVYLPAGTYKVSPGTNTYCLTIRHSNVVLRGAGKGKTFILNSSYQMRSKAIIKVYGNSGWYGTPTDQAVITQNLTGPTRNIPVQNASAYKAGDIVVVRNYINDQWITEHKVTDWLGYGSSLRGLAFCREVLSVNYSTNTITIDAPIRYTLLTRDNSIVLKVNSMLSEIGIESLSIGNVQNPSTTGFGESDYNTSGNASYDCHASSAISIQGVYNSWIRDVATFQPAGNTTTAHILSNGIVINECKNITVESCHFQRPQYGGGGGNGYMYRITGSENLIKNCTAEFMRHGFVFSSMSSSGNVIHQCNDIRTGRATGSTGSYKTSGSGSDHHMHFSTSNLIDQCSSENSFFAAGYRNYGSNPKHGITAAHTVYWNLKANNTDYSQVVHTQQSRYGYAIGTSGTGATVKTGELSLSGSSTITAPVDHVEGQGTGATLYPQSLFLDQLSKRLNTTEYAIPGKVEAENYSSMFGIQTQTTSDVGGGENVGWVDTDDWMDYKVNVASSGSYKVEFRVASTASTGQLQLKSGSTILATATIPNTGAWQTWTTVTATVNLTAGSQTLRVYASSSPFNLNWINFTKVVNQAPSLTITSPSAGASFTAPASINIAASATDSDGSIAKVEFLNGTTLLETDVSAPYNFDWNNIAAGNYTINVKATDNSGSVTTKSVSISVVDAIIYYSIPGTIQAEDYADMFGIQTQATSDVGGGSNVGWIATGDWLDYTVNVTKAASYKVAYRVASTGSTGQIQLQKGSTILATTNVPNTGDWQTWTTVSATVNLTAGQQTLRVYASGPSFNFNWMEFTEIVVPTNQSPVVSITSPASGASFTAPASITITATATDSDGSISKVEFFNGSTLLGSDASAPYSYSWTSVAAGNYTINVKATDNSGATSSKSISITVNNPVSNSIGINGQACVIAGGKYTYTVNPDGSSSSVSWWSNSSATITQSSTDYKTITIEIPSSMNGTSFTLSAGVNLTTSPWYKEYSKTIKVGGCTTAKMSATPEEQATISPNPIENSFTITTNERVENVSILNITGEVVYEGTDTNVELSDELSAGIYTVVIRYVSGRSESKRIQKIK